LTQQGAKVATKNQPLRRRDAEKALELIHNSLQPILGGWYMKVTQQSHAHAWKASDRLGNPIDSLRLCVSAVHPLIHCCFDLRVFPAGRPGFTPEVATKNQPLRRRDAEKALELIHNSLQPILGGWYMKVTQQSHAHAWKASDRLGNPIDSLRLCVSAVHPLIHCCFDLRVFPAGRPGFTPE
jgi:hypothetical protein